MNPVHESPKKRDPVNRSEQGRTGRWRERQTCRRAAIAPADRSTPKLARRFRTRCSRFHSLTLRFRNPPVEIKRIMQRLVGQTESQTRHMSLATLDGSDEECWSRIVRP